MTWKEKTIVRILFLIMKMLVDNPELKKELEQLGTHISVHAKEV